MYYYIVCLLLYATSVLAQETPHELRVPDAPEGVRVQTTATTAILWWQPPSSTEVLVRGYTVEYGIGAPTFRIVIEGAETNSFTITRLIPNTTYVFALSAYNEADGEDGERVFVSATTKTNSDERGDALWPPTEVRGVARGAGVVDVSWKDPNPDFSENSFIKNQRHYIVQYGLYQSEHHKRIRSNSRAVKLNGLLPGKEYEIAVQAIADDGRESPWSIRDVVLTPTDPNVAVSRFDWSCDFSKDFCGMSAGEAWQRPAHGAGSGQLLLRASDVEGTSSSLVSPVFHMQSSAALCLQIYLMPVAANDGILSVQIRDEKRESQKELVDLHLSKLKPKQWQRFSVPIPAQRHAFRFIIEASWTSSHPTVAIGDLSIASGVCQRSDGSRLSREGSWKMAFF